MSIEAQDTNHRPTPEQAELDTFQDLGRQLLSNVLADPNNFALRHDFRTAFDYRSSYPWLVEAGQLPGQRPGQALPDALGYALSSGFSAPNRTEPPITEPSLFDEAWSAELVAAVPQIRALRLRQYAFQLTYDGISLSAESSEEIQDHMTKLLEKYYLRREYGLSADPW
ncbi:MAG: hypothetical protein JWN38_481 [Candidatus Saccharibacteria bacterium]|nr:hypothetical protein [Candidatus Saccharibacteria bacterium]